MSGEYELAARINHWRRIAGTWVVTECNALGITSSRATVFTELPRNVRDVMRVTMETVVRDAADRERPPSSLKPYLVEKMLQEALTFELRQFKPPTPADRAASQAELS